jgi:hypothetical protein
MTKKNACLLIGILLNSIMSFAQGFDDLLKDDEPKKNYINNAFKSTRVINGQSIEMLGTGVLDVRILHRFGYVTSGIGELFGLDNARMRMGLDYGVTKNINIGIGRSNYNKELDGFLKWRAIHQHTGAQASPISLIYVGGITCKAGTLTALPTANTFANRLGYMHQILVGRKFNRSFSMQLAPMFIHQNLVTFNADKNNFVAVGVGARYKLSNRVAVLIDAHPIISGARKDFNRLPLSIGFDIETGGHVFQLHFSNSKGMNERAFLTETSQQWTKSEFQFGFNLSRVFQVVKNKD